MPISSVKGLYSLISLVRSHRSLAGIHLTHLGEGLRDLNAARRSITERYLLECDEIFAVCNIGRATTDVGVSSVFELARQANLTNVGIVCTRSDVSILSQSTKLDLIHKSITGHSRRRR
jgi:hypothetical protein